MKRSGRRSQVCGEMENSSQLKQSDKIHVIDRATYEEIQKQQQQQQASVGGRPVRNGKFRKMQMRTAFDLLQYVKKGSGEHGLRARGDRGGSIKRKRKVRQRAATHVGSLPSRRGKQREGGRKKPLSRFKKSILRHRQSKRQRTQQECPLNEAVKRLETLAITAKEPEQQHIAGLHSRRFRSYCGNCTTELLRQLTDTLLRQLNRFQRRAFAQNEIKARAHRRFVVGFREVQSLLRISKLKLVVVAPDCEQCEGEAGIDEAIASIKRQCQDQQLPLVFSLQRRELAYALFKKVPIACVGILDYDGAQETVAQLLSELRNAKQMYVDLRNQFSTRTATSNATACQPKGIQAEHHFTDGGPFFAN